MPLSRADALPEGDNWLYEVKFDRYRAIAFESRRGREHLRSPNDKDFAARSKRDTQPDDAVIAGEIVALDDADRPSFSPLQSGFARDGFVLRENHSQTPLAE